MVAEVVFGVGETLLRNLNVLIQFGAVIVHGPLGWVDGGFQELEVPFMVLDFLGDVQVLEVFFNFLVLSKVGDCVVNWIS